MEFPPLIEKHVKIVEDEIENFQFPPLPEGLYEPVSYLLTLGGKRIRPALTLTAAGMYGLPPEKALSQAMAVEVFHNFTLMHDDIMDKAPLRRGMKTVHEKWNVNTAVLSGDAMLIKAYELLARDTESRHLPVLIDIFNKTAAEVCEGQQHDMNFETATEVTPDQYIEMIRLKTAVLLAAALQIGAVKADADEREAKLLYDFGQNLGIAFQIKDDLLDAYGNSAATGKQRGGDILAGKKTLLFLYALQHDSIDDVNMLHSWLKAKGDIQDDEIIDGVLGIFDRLGVKAAAEKEMEKYSQKALESLMKLQPADQKLKRSLYDLAYSLLNREF